MRALYFSSLDIGKKSFYNDVSVFSITYRVCFYERVRIVIWVYVCFCPDYFS